MDFAVIPEHAALLNIDLQNCFVEGTPNGIAIVERVNQIADVCRRAGILVIHTSHVLRPDGSNMGILRDLPKARDGLLFKGAPSAALYPNLVVDPRDLLLEKPRFGAFYGTDLELILRAHGIDTLIISGISTSVCCDTTAREAHARDFRVLFFSDATATPGGEEDQRATLDTIEDLFAQVLSAEALLQKITVTAR